MTTDLMPFTYEGSELRSFVIDGEPWFVAADVARLLEYSATAAMTRRLDDEDKGVRNLHTLGGVQQMAIISEAGFYEAILGSQSGKAKAVKRWLTHEVLPTLRKTGSYSTAPALTDDELIHRALEVSARRVAELSEKVAELEPKAEVADRLLDAEGDLSVRDAAQALTRAGIKTGQNRLFAELEGRHWISRARGDGRWRVIQSAIDAGCMSVLPQSHYHPKSGELVMDPPQPRVTPKGLQRLLSDFTKGSAA